MRAHAVALALLAVPAAAQTDPRTDPTYPAAQCAAYWLAFAEFAARSAFLDADPSDAARSAAFRAAAVRLNGGDATTIDAYIRRQRPDMALMIEAAIYGDKISDDLQRRLLKTCDRFAPTQPETRDLR